uniref:Uncharacterized protein n=1 Tax=Arundo donax TaxID=35708 RepID=A0A0A8ZR21_ARUDO
MLRTKFKLFTSRSIPHSLDVVNLLC